MHKAFWKVCSCLCRLSYLQKHTAEHIINLREECWQPLIYYRASLLAVAEGEDAVSYVSSDRKPHMPNRSPFSKQKLEGTKLNNKVKHRIFMFSLSQSTSCIVCNLFFGVILGGKSPCPSNPADSKDSKVHRSSFSPRWGSGILSYFQNSHSFNEANRFFFFFSTLHIWITVTSSNLSHQEKTPDMDPFSVPVEPPVKRLNIEASVLSTGSEADEDTVEIEL